MVITANVYQRIFLVKFGNVTGTAFTIDHNCKQYLISALHVFPNVSENDTIEVMQDGNWTNWAVKLVGQGQRYVLEEDVIVFALNDELPNSLTFPATSADIVFGQDVYFLGFPYELRNHYNTADGHPLPLVKKAIFSGIVGGNNQIFLLDGHNNPGFSGGPAIFRRSNNPREEFHVFGVISGYQEVDENVKFEGQPTRLTSPSNTGIIVCLNIEFAISLIDTNPIGATIS